ncbi:MAG: hypothetical protein AAF675_06600 [Pseudomonadota bacterium]
MTTPQRRETREERRARQRDFARRFTVPMMILFGGALVFGLLQGNLLAIAGGLGGMLWIVAARRQN